jgi:hypothetical protein
METLELVVYLVLAANILESVAVIVAAVVLIRRGKCE